MVNFHIEYKGQKKTYSLPSSWEEVTVQQFIALEVSGGYQGKYVQLLQDLTGAPLPVIQNTKTDLQLQIRSALEFIITKPPNWNKLARRDKYKFKGAFFEVPENLELETALQKILVQNKLNSTKNVAECIPYVIAVYMQKVINGYFDEQKAAVLEEEVLQMPIVEMFSLATFFFRRLLKYKRGGIPGLKLYL